MSIIFSRERVMLRKFSRFLFVFGLLVLGLNSVLSTSPSDYLIFSAERGHLQHTKKALHNGANVNTKDYFKRTALMYASGNGSIEIVKLLLHRGAAVGINERDRDGKTAFMFAKEKGFAKIMEILLEYGAVAE
jgi:ankyrin repeat protein